MGALAIDSSQPTTSIKEPMSDIPGAPKKCPTTGM